MQQENTALSDGVVLSRLFIFALVAVTLVGSLLFYRLQTDTAQKWIDNILRLAKDRLYFQIILSAAMVGLAYCALILKAKHQVFYGFLEFSVAIVATVATVFSLQSTMDDMTAKWTLLVGSIYFITRGMNNVLDGLKLKAKSPGPR